MPYCLAGDVYIVLFKDSTPVHMMVENYENVIDELMSRADIVRGKRWRNGYALLLVH